MRLLANSYAGHRDGNPGSSPGQLASDQDEGVFFSRGMNAKTTPLPEKVAL